MKTTLRILSDNLYWIITLLGAGVLIWWHSSTDQEGRNKQMLPLREAIFGPQENWAGAERRNVQKTVRKNVQSGLSACPMCKTDGSSSSCTKCLKGLGR